MFKPDGVCTASLASKDVFLSRVSVKPGELFNRSKLSDDLQKLTDYYKDRGYAYVNASPTTPVNDRARRVATFHRQNAQVAVKCHGVAG